MPRRRPSISSRLRSRNSPASGYVVSEQTSAKDDSISGTSADEIAFSPRNDTMIYLDEIQSALSFERRSEHEKEQSLLEEANKLAYTFGDINVRSSNFYRANVAPPIASKRKQHLMHSEPILKALPTTFIIHKHSNAYTKNDKEKIFSSHSPSPVPLSTPSPVTSSSSSASPAPIDSNKSALDNKEKYDSRLKSAPVSEEEKKRRRRVLREHEFRRLKVDVAKIPDIDAPRATRSHTQSTHTEIKESSLSKKAYNRRKKSPSPLPAPTKKAKVGRPRKIKTETPASDNQRTTNRRRDSHSSDTNNHLSVPYTSISLAPHNTMATTTNTIEDIFKEPAKSSLLEITDTVNSKADRTNVSEPYVIDLTAPSTVTKAADNPKKPLKEASVIHSLETIESKVKHININGPSSSDFSKNGLDIENPVVLDSENSDSEFSDSDSDGPDVTYSRRKPSRRLASFERNKKKKEKILEDSPENSESVLDKPEENLPVAKQDHFRECVNSEFFPYEEKLNKNISLSKKVTFSCPVVADIVPKRATARTLSAVIRPSVIPLPLIPTIPKDANRRLFVHSRYISNEEAAVVAQSVYSDQIVTVDNKLVKSLQKTFEKYRVKLKRIFDDLARVLDVRKKEIMKEQRILKLLISNQMDERILKSIWGYWIEDPYIAEDEFYECEGSVSLLKEVTVQAVVSHYREKYGLSSSAEYAEEMKRLDRITRALNLPECDETEEK
ncbi:hypothetical protein BY458DRAFT_516823 [Sporodiniella umbellata]|nr:hypothetical protein BY458DRAFT_516823 [Sporodiniella umbellata]